MDDEARSVVVEDIHMDFWSMVGFMVKWAIASIPAAAILVVIVSLLMFSINALFTRPAF